LKRKPPFKILIVDDSRTIVKVLTHLFEQEGFVVETAADGVEAIKTFFRSPPDLVVLDIEMPRMNGFQVCRILKDDPDMRLVTIIILTSHDMQSKRFHGISAGADAYLVNNLEDDLLIKTARELVQLSPLLRTSKPHQIDLDEGEILIRVNNLLDRKLFVSNIINILQDINNHVDSLPGVLMKVLDVFGVVFEFVVGGIVVKTNDEGSGAIIVHKEFGNALTDEFENYLKGFAKTKCKISFEGGVKWDKKSFEGINIKIFPQATNLTSKFAWKLQL